MAKDKNSSGIARATTSGGTASTRGRGAGGGSDTIASSTSGGSASARASAGGSDGTPDTDDVRMNNLRTAQSKNRDMTPDEAASYHVSGLTGNTSVSMESDNGVTRLGKGNMSIGEMNTVFIKRDAQGKYSVSQTVRKSRDKDRNKVDPETRVFADGLSSRAAAVKKARSILDSTKGRGFDGQLLLNSGEVSAEKTRIRGIFGSSSTPARSRTSPRRRQSTIEPSSGARNGPATAPRATAPVTAPAPRGPRGATPAGLRRSGPGNRRVSLPNAPGMPRGAGGTARRERANKAYRKLEQEAQSLAAAQSGAKDSMRRAVSTQRRQELNRDIGDMRGREVQVRNRLTKAVRNSRAIEKSRAASRSRRQDKARKRWE